MRWKRRPSRSPGSPLVEEGWAVLRVEDTGVGIPDSEKAKVFVPYYSKSPKGTGLGLAIVKRIIEDHGGTIEVHDHLPKGTSFVITLPLQ